MDKTKPTTYIYLAFTLAALLIVADLLVPGEVVTDRITFVKKERQQHHNASKNFHYSYAVMTDNSRFSVSEDFANSAQVGDDIEYAVSRVFGEVNWYQSPSTEDKSYSTIRILSGLVVPLLVIVTLFAACKSERNINTFAFVMQVLLIADLVYLIL